jgi:hypothetical protein
MDLIRAVKDVAAEIGAPTVCPISTAHRIGGRGDKPRPVFVRFTARRDKVNIMKSKKHLKDNQHIKNDNRFGDKVIILDDLTEPRMKLLKIVREHEDTEFAYI